MNKKRITLRVQVTVPVNHDKRLVEKILVDLINAKHSSYDAYARVLQEDPA